MFGTEAIMFERRSVMFERNDNSGKRNNSLYKRNGLVRRANDVIREGEICKDLSASATGSSFLLGSCCIVCEKIFFTIIFARQRDKA